MLRDASLEPTIWYGDYDGSKYDVDSSKRMIVLARAVPERGSA